LRKTEISFLRKIGIAWAVMCIMFTSLPLVMSLLTFTVYALWGGPGGTHGPFTPQLVFICVTLFARLGQPIGRVSGIANTIINMNVAVKRIQGLLLEDELDRDTIEQLDSSTEAAVEGPAIVVEDGTFAWTSEIDVEKKKKADAIAAAKVAKSTATESAKPDTTLTDPTAAADQKEVKDSSPLLKRIDVKIDRGSLTMVVGRVGQGKSSLISAIIGEMYKIKGRVAVRGSLAYCPQSSWIINASVKDNILFGKPMDQERYIRVLECCNLLPDLAIFPANDDTEIGERGINLSGGQKQRVSLARAAYQDADIYIMDDPLSAVDAEVDQYLWKQLIGPDGLLKDKTRLLVTHGIHHLADADQILVIKDGEIVETGQYKDLLDAKLGFYQLIMDYAVQQQVKEATDGLDSKEGVDLSHEVIADDLVIDQTVQDLTLVKEGDDGQLIQAEEAAIGSVGWGVFHRYIKSA